MIEIICEIGKNFVDTEQEQPLSVLLDKAKKLVDAAKDAGADTAKFQVHNFKDEIHPEAHIVSPHFNHDRYAWVKRNTYPVEFWHALKEHCGKVGIEFLATPMSRGAAMLLDEVGVDRWKIGSGDILDFVMLDYIRNTGKPVILSSGMSTLEELKKAYGYLREKTQDVSILHCVSQYPCPLEALNLNTIPFLKKQFPDARIGFSDHSIGIEGSLMAVSLGAEIIEKHFTFDRTAWGPDHKVSLLPQEMHQLVRHINYYNADLCRKEINKKGFHVTDTKDGPVIRRLEKGEPFQPVITPLEPTEEALGIETKYLRPEEEEFRPVFRKGLYAAREIQEGELLEPDMLYAMRPTDGTPSEEYPSVIGEAAVKYYKQFDPI